MHLQIYSGLSLIFAILRNFRVAGANGFISWANIVFFIQSVNTDLIKSIGDFTKVTLGPLFRSKNDENCACITKNINRILDLFLNKKVIKKHAFTNL